MHSDRIAHENEGRAKVLVTLLGIVSVKLGGLLAIGGEEGSTGIIGPRWLEELLEGRMDAFRESDVLL